MILIIFHLDSTQTKKKKKKSVLKHEIELYLQIWAVQIYLEAPGLRPMCLGLLICEGKKCKSHGKYIKLRRILWLSLENLDFIPQWHITTLPSSLFPLLLKNGVAGNPSNFFIFFFLIFSLLALASLSLVSAEKWVTGTLEVSWHFLPSIGMKRQLILFCIFVIVIFKDDI